MIAEFQNPTIIKIVNFLRGIGLSVRAASFDEPTFLEGILIHQGALLVDESKLKHPGDLLHEAGHLAVVPSENRNLDGNAGKDAGEEMAAIAWSYAALTHLGLEPVVVFHAEGYRGESESIIDNFTNGRYFGVPILQWRGLTVEKKPSLEMSGEFYPNMKKWLAD